MPVEVIAMPYPPQGAVGGISKLSELIIDADKDWNNKRITNLRAIEVSNPMRLDSNVLASPPMVQNVLGFRPVYKAEEYVSGSWNDVTGNYTWSYLTDLKGTEVSITTTAGVDRRFRIYIDCLSAWIYIGVIIFYGRWIDSLKEFVVESATTSDFTSGVTTHLSWSGDIYAWDYAYYFRLDTEIINRYMRITFTIKRNTDGSMRIKQIVGLATKYSPIMFETHYPFDWDYNRHIYPVSDNTNDLGSASRRWKTGYFVNIDVGDIMLKNGMIISERGDDIVIKNSKGEVVMIIESDGGVVIGEAEKKND